MSAGNGASREPRSYRDYLIQSGGKYIPIQYGEALSESDREYVTQTYRKYMVSKNLDLSKPVKENWIEYSIKEHLKGIDLTPIVVDGKIMSGMEYMNYLDRQDQEAIARGEDPYARPRAPLVLKKLHFDEPVPLTREQQKQRAIPIVDELKAQLEDEVWKREELDLIAEHIRKKTWGDTNAQRPLALVVPARQGDIIVEDDGTVINRIGIGFSLSYPYDGRREQNRQQALENDLYMGIGYFTDTDRSHIIPEAQGVVTDEGFKHGFKAYFEGGK